MKNRINLSGFVNLHKSFEVEKAYTEGIYADTPANRKLGRAGMSYKDFADKTHKSDDKGDKKNNSDDNSNNKKKDWVKEYPLKLKELIKNSVGQLDGSDKEATDKQVDNIFNSVSDSVDITEKNGVFNVEVNSRAFYRSAQDNDLDFGYGGAEDIGPELDRYLNKNFGKREKEGKKQSPEERIKKDEERREKEAKEKNKFKKESNIAKEKFDKNIIGEIDTSSIKHNMSFSALRKYPLLKDCSNDFVMKLSEAMKGEEDRIVRLKSPSDKPLFAIISSYREKKYPDDASNGYAIILQNNEDPEYAWKISNKGSNGYIDIYKEYKAKLNNSGKQYKLLNDSTNNNNNIETKSNSTPLDEKWNELTKVAKIPEKLLSKKKNENGDWEINIDDEGSINYYENQPNRQERLDRDIAALFPRKRHGRGPIRYGRGPIIVKGNKEEGKNDSTPNKKDNGEKNDKEFSDNDNSDNKNPDYVKVAKNGFKKLIKDKTTQKNGESPTDEQVDNVYKKALKYLTIERDKSDDTFSVNLNGNTLNKLAEKSGLKFDEGSATAETVQYFLSDYLDDKFTSYE